MKEVNRRQFLSIGGGSAILALAGAPWKNLAPTIKAPEKQGKIIADLHCHPSRKNKLEDILQSLSGVLTAPSYINGHESKIRYELLKDLTTSGYSFKEIDKGIFGKFEYKNYKSGYILKCQEVASEHDVLALGCPSDYLPDYKNIKKTITEIQERGGIAIMPHPYIVNSGDWAVYRLITKKEYEHFKEGFQMADEIEIDNGQCIDTTPLYKDIPFFFNRINMIKANRQAKEMVEKEFPSKKGTAASDAHNELVQLHSRGIYLPEENLCFDSIKENIQNGSFERFPDNIETQTVNIFSWLKGMFYYNHLPEVYLL